MSLHIELYINDKWIGGARVDNISNLADTSDYNVFLKEQGAEHLGIDPNYIEASIHNHDRKQSVWKLVEKVARLVK